MKYQVSGQFAQDKENLIAEFKDQDDAIFFITRKSLSDEEKGVTLIYRLYGDEKLLKEFNREKIRGLIRNGAYASGDQFFPRSLGPYKIGTEISPAHAFAAFIQLSDAELFVEDKLTQLTAISTYYIFKNDEIIAELNQQVKKQKDPETQGKGQTASFRPTPLNMTARPPGTPANWIKDEEEKHK